MTALWRVLVPISIPGIVSVGIYTFMIAWNEYLFALTLDQDRRHADRPDRDPAADGPALVRMERDDGHERSRLHPHPLLFLFFQRYFIGGMSAGAVK